MYCPSRRTGVLVSSTIQTASTYPSSGWAAGQDGSPCRPVLVIQSGFQGCSVLQASRLRYSPQHYFRRSSEPQLPHGRITATSASPCDPDRRTHGPGDVPDRTPPIATVQGGNPPRRSYFHLTALVAVVHSDLFGGRKNNRFAPGLVDPIAVDELPSSDERGKACAKNLREMFNSIPWIPVKLHRHPCVENLEPSDLSPCGRWRHRNNTSVRSCVNAGAKKRDVGLTWITKQDRLLLHQKA